MVVDSAMYFSGASGLDGSGTHFCSFQRGCAFLWLHPWRDKDSAMFSSPLRFLATLGLCVAALSAGGAASDSAAVTNADIAADFRGLELWYQQPAKEWTEALPVGNGRLGAMVFGGVAAETIQLNEDRSGAAAQRRSSLRRGKQLPKIRAGS
jgi:hypothetical protein